MLGYYSDDEATRKGAPDGWFRTGDLGVMCPDGYVALRDRAKDIIISGGETFVDRSRGGADEPRCGPRGGRGRGARRQMGRGPRRVRHDQGGAAASDAELIEHVRERLARFKAPKRVIFGPLPKTATGKVQKKALRDQLRAG